MYLYLSHVLCIHVTHIIFPHTIALAPTQHRQCTHTHIWYSRTIDSNNYHPCACIHVAYVIQSYSYGPYRHYSTVTVHYSTCVYVLGTLCAEYKLKIKIITKLLKQIHQGAEHVDIFTRMSPRVGSVVSCMCIW